jgi:hypothetical protein
MNASGINVIRQNKMHSGELLTLEPSPFEDETANQKLR